MLNTLKKETQPAQPKAEIVQPKVEQSKSAPKPVSKPVKKNTTKGDEIVSAWVVVPISFNLEG